jgi:hypothetical protein
VHLKAYLLIGDAVADGNCRRRLTRQLVAELFTTSLQSTPNAKAKKQTAAKPVGCCCAKADCGNNLKRKQLNVVRADNERMIALAKKAGMQVKWSDGDTVEMLLELK